MHSLAHHPIITAIQDIRDLCKPLLRLDISYFSHVRIDKNNNFSCLSTCPEFASHYIEKKYFNDDIHIANNHSIGKYVVWDLLEYTGRSEKMLIEGIELGQQHNFTIYQANENSHDYYHFATRPNNPSINQIYINNIVPLEKFINHFNSNVSQNRILKSAYDIKFSISDEHAKYSALNLQNKENNEMMLFEEHPNIANLTPAQLNCLRHLLAGKSAKEIAKKLGISHRTVEHHLERIRIITGFKTSREIIANYNLINV